MKKKGIGYVRGRDPKERDSQSKTLMYMSNIERIYSDTLKEDNWNFRDKHINNIPKGYTLIVVSMAVVSNDIQEFLEFIEKLDSKGIGFISISEGIDTLTAYGKGLIGLLRGSMEFLNMLHNGNEAEIPIDKTIQAVHKMENGISLIEKKYKAYRKRQLYKRSEIQQKEMPIQNEVITRIDYSKYSGNRNSTMEIRLGDLEP